MLTQPGRWAAAVLAAVAAVALCAGCGGSSSPKTLPPIRSTPSAFTSVSATPTSTTTSKQAELAAATAVVKRYYVLLGSPTTLQTAKSLSAVITKGCKCQQVVTSIRDAVARHEHYVGNGHLTLVRPSVDSSDRAEVLVKLNSSAGGLVRSDGSYVSHQAAQHGVVENVYLTRLDGAWRVFNISLVNRGNS